MKKSITKQEALEILKQNNIKSLDDLAEQAEKHSKEEKGDLPITAMGVFATIFAA